MFDAHLHIIDPRFPLTPNQGFTPDSFTVEDYLENTAALEIVGGAVVSGSFQGFDQSYLLDALSRLGPSFVGVTQLPVTASDTEIARLDAAGVRAVRFNLYRGGAEDLDNLERLAHRVYDRAGWHVELYLSASQINDLEARLTRLPRIAIDHLGMTREAYPALLRLVESGAKIKATGFGRVQLDVAEALREISAADPSALMFGTDLPGTRARRPFQATDIDIIVATLGDSLARRVLHENAEGWYRQNRKT